ncbi:MAG: PLP-dependent aspartate aminotransferase family protein [Candidatus Hydrogenedentes bacterium]|nr:PLP-dependent aspartate aminotransferase family protein [Candidatus Hydrogenedentota bacterium]
MRFRTRAIHAGQGPDPQHGAVMTPVFQSSTFAFNSPDDPGEFDYSRSGNPTRKALEECLASLENGTRGFAFATGMAAETTLMMLCNAGDHLIASDECYGGTYRVLMSVMKTKGIEIELVDLGDLNAVRHAIKPNTKMLWIESPTNPLMKVVDIQALAKIGAGNGIITVVDNTFLSPYLQNPLDLGIDIVVHSTTKYINGHSDVVGGGVVVKDDKLAEQIYFLQNAIGAVPGPWDCFLVLRGIKTLALRMEAHQKNAQALAEFLEQHPKIDKVLYPGLPSHPQYELNKKQARGAGGMLSFYIKGGVEEAYDVLGKLELFSQAVSLGGVESLIEYPWTMTHGPMPKSARREMGIEEKLIRVPVGLEDVDDLLADFAQALE